MVLLRLATLALWSLSFGVLHADPAAPPRAPSADESLRALMEGNARFVRGESLHPHESAAYRRSVVDEQRPVAVVLTCSDSRVKPSLVFDQGFGDIFVVMVAGGVVGEDVAGSIEYAVEHLKTPLVIVMGHKNCGAVGAAYHSYAARDLGERELHEIETLLQRIEPAVRDLDPALPAPEQIDKAIRQNTTLSVDHLRNLPSLRRALEAGRVEIHGAYYDLETGRVSLQSE